MQTGGMTVEPLGSWPLWDTVLRVAPCSLFLFDEQLTCRYAAPDGDAFLGRPRQQLIGRPVWEVLPAAELLTPALQRAARGAEPWRLPQLRAVHPDSGREHIWAASVDPVHTEQYRGALLTLFDIGELIAERNELRAEVERLQRALGDRARQVRDLEFFLRSALAPAFGYLQVIARRARLLDGRAPAAVIEEQVLPRLREVVATLDAYVTPPVQRSEHED